jgi:hypothetical protein
VFDEIFPQKFYHKASVKAQIDSRLHAHMQLLRSFLWTPVQRAACSDLSSVHRDVHLSLSKYPWLAAGDGPIPVFTACSLRCILVQYTITESLLLRLFEILFESLLKILDEKTPHQEE